MLNIYVKILQTIISNKEILEKFFVKYDIKYSDNNINLLLSSNEDFCIKNFAFYLFFKKYFSKRLPEHLWKLDETFQNVFDFLGNEDISEIESNFLDINYESIENFYDSYIELGFIYKNGSVDTKKTKESSKYNGTFYTPLSICKEMVEKTLRNYQKSTFTNMKILDFCSGTGRFYFMIIDYLINCGIEIKNITDKILYAYDNDKNAIIILAIKLIEKYGKRVSLKNIGYKNLLMDDNSGLFSLNHHKFSIIISNPPYLNLKINGKESDDIEQEILSKRLKDKINKELEYFRNSGKYKHAIEGMLNYYKLSIEKMISSLEDKGELCVICPSTLFGDLSSKKIRQLIFDQNTLYSIQYFKESDKLFENVSQSTVIFNMTKGGKTREINIRLQQEEFVIDYKPYQKIFGKHYELPLMPKIGWDILEKMSKFNKLKEIKNIRNRRGELDLTLGSKYITKEITKHKLLRGNNMDNIDSSSEYVLDSFFKTRSDEYHKFDYGKKRIGCKQISNIDMKRRLTFYEIPNNAVLANSCNYISLSEYNDDYMFFLYNLLNSLLLNWRFKITSTNNHVNNYEIDEFPILEYQKFSGNNLEKNISICKLYGLNNEEIYYILSDFFTLEEINKCLKQQ